MDRRKKRIGVNLSHGGSRWWRCALLVLVGLMITTGCEQQEDSAGMGMEFAVVREYEKGPLKVLVKVERETMSIADTVVLQLETMIGEGYELDLPAVGQALGEYEFGILDFSAPADKLLDDKRVLKVRQYQLEPIVSGSYSIPEFRFVFRKRPDDAAGAASADAASPEQYELITEAIPLEVSSLLDEQRDNLALADIKNVAAWPSSKTTWWLWAVGGVAIVLAGGVVIVWARRRRKQTLVRIIKTAHEVAYEKLRKLQEQGLISEGKVQEFYERISDILRQYIEHRFTLHAPQQTTEEFMQEAQASAVLREEDRAILKCFLEHCDLVKFARYGPSKQEIDTTFELTRTFIDATKTQQRQVDVTDELAVGVGDTGLKAG